MSPPKRPKRATLLQSIDACLENGSRLLDETYDLEYQRLAASRFYLTMVAQEEFAKAFIVFLIMEEVIPIGAAVHRAMNDHSCKQLVGMIMDYAIMHWETTDEMDAAIEADCSQGELLPNDVGSAIEILRYEKVAKWEGRYWGWLEDPNYDRSALRIAEGKKDRRKQDALYVRLGRDAQIASTPTVITEQERTKEYDRARRYMRFVMSLVEGESQNRRYDKATAALKVLFASREADV